MPNDELDNLLENQNEKMTETNQLLENVLENGDDGNKKVVKAIKESKPDFSGIETIKGKTGDKGEKGDKPTEEELEELIKPLIPKPIKGDKGDSVKGDRGDSIKGDKGDNGENIKGDKGEKGDSGKDGKNGKDADIKEIVKILKKSKISYKDLKDVPNIYKGKLMGSGYLREITDCEIESPTNGQALVYDASKKRWLPSTVLTGSGTVENISSQCDGSTTVFTTTSNNGIMWLTLNGTMLIEGKEFVRDSATQITLTFAPDTGEELYLKYI